jgi:hypothetical protein
MRVPTRFQPAALEALTLLRATSQQLPAGHDDLQLLVDAAVEVSRLIGWFGSARHHINDLAGTAWTEAEAQALKVAMSYGQKIHCREESLADAGKLRVALEGLRTTTRTGGNQ